MLAGTLTIGAVVSTTVTVKVLLPTFAWLSVAVQVTVVVPSAKIDPLDGVQPTATVPSSRSAADAVKLNGAPAVAAASTVAFAGTVTTGAVVSRTVTVNVVVPVFAWLSVARHVTVVVVAGNVEPLGGVQMAASGPSMLSVAVAANVNGAPVVPVASIAAFAGTVTTGAVVSTTVTVNVFVEMFERLSAALQFTVVAPNGNVDPLAGVQLTVTLPLTLSIADVVYVNAAPVGAVASTVALAGTVMIGPVVSVTVTENVLFAGLPRVSTAPQVTAVGPSGKVDPLAGTQLTGRVPSTRSVADTV
jgi:hypothetical protein